MSARYDDYTPKVSLDVQTKTNIFLRMVLDTVDRNADPITPRRSGLLRNSTLKRVLGTRGTIIWNKVYAKPQETGIVGRGYPVRHYTTPGTGAHYAERAVRKTETEIPAILRKVGLS